MRTLNPKPLNPEPQIWHLEITLRSPYVGKLPFGFGFKASGRAFSTSVITITVLGRSLQSF